MTTSLLFNHMMPVIFKDLAIGQFGSDAKMPDTRLIERDIGAEVTLHAHQPDGGCSLPSGVPIFTATVLLSTSLPVSPSLSITIR
ncbi:MAG: hypothetical protein R2864_05110 [Syntrophotaleaceae bacterium]